jgi:YD repeat-containing protein
MVLVIMLTPRLQLAQAGQGQLAQEGMRQLELPIHHFWRYTSWLRRKRGIMQLTIGNNRAIETGYDDEGNLTSKSLPGERTTHLSFPEGMDSLTAFKTTIAALTRHLEAGAKPVWIESDNKTLRRLLIEHYGLQVTKSNRPDDWGGTP